MGFEVLWATLQASLRVGQTIPNWTQAQGLTGEPFTIKAIAGNTISVDPPGAENIQHVPRRDFERVYNHWADYRNGRFPRHGFNPLTHYSKYVISLLYWLEVHSGGRLPS